MEAKRIEYQHLKRVTIGNKLLTLAESERRARLKVFGVMLAMDGGIPGRDALAMACQKFQTAHEKVNTALKGEKKPALVIEELHRRGLV